MHANAFYTSDGAKCSRKIKTFLNFKSGHRFLTLILSDDDLLNSSSILRMLAYKLSIVSSNDIIITADVDAFIETPSILEPLNQVNFTL